MMNRFFRDPKTIQRLREGPLSVYTDQYAALLHEQGYLKRTACQQLRLIADFSRWLQQENLEVNDVDQVEVKRYLRYRYQQVHPNRSDAAALNRLLSCLGKKGIGKDSMRPTTGAYQTVEDRFRRYLSQERGLSPATLSNYLPFVHQFLWESFGTNSINFAALCPTNITGFIQRHAHEISPGRAKLMVTALRAFLRHLRHRGEIVTDLAACVPCVPNWSFSSLPKFLQPSQVQCVLDHCSRQTAPGKRDYAILLLLTRLGLRAGEVVALTFEDIDWECGELSIRGKGGHRVCLPLPVDAGEAIADYLQKGRPSCSSRRVFIRQKAPPAGFVNSVAIGSLVTRALARAGVDSPRKGAHLFRHTLATQMLQQGASLSEIGELLRHRSQQTTTIYAKVDFTALRTLAPPGQEVTNEYSERCSQRLSGDASGLSIGRFWVLCRVPDYAEGSESVRVFKTNERLCRLIHSA